MAESHYVPDDHNKVADAIKHSWVYYLPHWLWPYAQLARWERPIGWQLLMWPCWWGALLAVAHAQFGGLANPPVFPDLASLHLAVSYNLKKFVPLFTSVLVPLFIGAFLMRGAGCTYNDLADIDIDNQVERTRSRPLPSGRVSRKQAIAFLVLQALGGLAILLYLARDSVFVFWLGVASLVLVAIYPFMKRITWWPQLFLGLAFSWGALVGWAVIWRELSPIAMLLYLGSIVWVVGYDTIYAHQDREDDALVGVKSTARLFGERSKTAIALLYAVGILLLASAYAIALPINFGPALPAWLGLLAGACQMIWQIVKLDIDDGEKCLRLFQSNNRFGLIVFSGLLASLLLAG